METTSEPGNASQVLALDTAVHSVVLIRSEHAENERKEYLGKVQIDELVFSLGAFAIIGSAWLAGAYPYCYWCFHAVFVPILLSYRLYITQQQNNQWFLIDFCYSVNYTVIVYYILSALGPAVPDIEEFMRRVGPVLFRCLFAACSGPLALAIAALRNSVVFHDWDILCVFMVHFSPAVAVWGMRWWPEELVHTFPHAFNIGCSHLPPQKTLFFSPDDCPGTFVELSVYPVLLCLAWAIPYSIFVFYAGAGYLARRGYHTVYEEMKEMPLFLILLKGEEKWKPLKYMSVHLFTISFAYLVVPLLWHSFAIHTTYMLLLLCIGLRNGGTYYFRVFAKKYYDSKMDSPGEAAIASEGAVQAAAMGKDSALEPP